MISYVKKTTTTRRRIKSKVRTRETERRGFGQGRPYSPIIQSTIDGPNKSFL